MLISIYIHVGGGNLKNKSNGIFCPMCTSIRYLLDRMKHVWGGLTFGIPCYCIIEHFKYFVVNS